MDISTILNLMGQYQLTADELLVVYLTFLAKDEEGHPEYFSQWFQNGGNTQLRSIFSSLQEKGVINKSYNPGTTYNPNEVAFNKNFLKGWPKYSNSFGMELFEAYPSWLNIDGKYMPLKDVAKKFNSLEDFCFAYGKAIGHNAKKHQEILDIIDWAKKEGRLNFSICNFLLSRQWEALKELRDDSSVVSIASNIYSDE